MGTAVRPEDADRCWNAMTPDLDIYPHLLAVPPLVGLLVCNGADDPDWNSAVGGVQERRPARRLYGSEWTPTPLEFVEALHLVPGPAAPILPVGAAVPPRPAAAVRLAGNLTSGEGVLPSIPGRVLRPVGAAASDEDLSDVACECFAKLKNKVLANIDGEAILAEFVDPDEVADPKEEGELDARVLAVKRGSSGERRRRYVDSLCDLTETEWAGWPVRGPRTASWCLQFIGEQDIGPRSRHTKWRTECDLTVMDPGVSEHELCMRLIDLAVTWDQINITELACFELVVRRAQLSEFRYRDRMCGSLENDDDHLFMGVGETRGLIMVAPALEEFLAAQLAKESAVMKERRKMREERQLAKEAPPSGRLSRKEEQRRRAAAKTTPQPQGGLGA